MRLVADTPPGAPASAKPTFLGFTDEPRQLAALLAIHVAVWTLWAWAAHGSVHHDMVEAFAWGQEFQLGYSKHPPLFAWIAGLWFSVMPRTSASFYLLAMLNSALGLAGAYAIATRLVSGSRIAVVALLMLTPLYNLYALKFNANTVLISLWPWTAYALVRMLETRSALHGALFGLLAAAAMLAKYYSGLLLLSCLVAALLHPAWRVLLRSPAPYVAVAVGTLAIGPHVAWMATNDFTTLEYAAATTRHPALAVFVRGMSALAQAVAFHVLPAALLISGIPQPFRKPLLKRFQQKLVTRDSAWIVVLAFGPLVLTFAAMFAANVRISAQFMIPIFFMVPTAAMALSGLRLSHEQSRRLVRPALILAGIALATAPLVATAALKLNVHGWSEPRREVAEAVTEAWRRHMGTPLAIVGGDERYSQSAAFYSPDRPSDFTVLMPRLAPWITPQRLAATGMAVICPRENAICQGLAEPYKAAPSRHVPIEVTPRLWGGSTAPRQFDLWLVPPGASLRAPPSLPPRTD